MGEGRTSGRIRVCAKLSESGESNLGQETAQVKAQRAKWWQKEELLLSRSESRCATRGTVTDRGRKAGASTGKTHKAW